MELTTAVELVWDNVAECVYRHPTVREAVDFARVELTDEELGYVLEQQREGAFDEVGDVYGAYVDVRAADDAALTAVVDELTATRCG